MSGPRRTTSAGDSDGEYEEEYAEDGRPFTSGEGLPTFVKRRTVKFLGKEGASRNDVDLYESSESQQTAPPEAAADEDISRQTTQPSYSRQNSARFSRQNSSYSRQNSFFNRQVSMLSRSSTFRSVLSRSNTFARTLTSVFTGRYDCEDEDEVEEAARHLEECRRKRLECGEGQLERMTTMAVKQTENFVKQITMPLNYVRSKTMERIRELQETLQSEEVQAKLQKVRTMAMHATTGRPSWHPEPPRVPVPSSCNLCSLFIIALAFLLPILFMTESSRTPIMNLFVKNVIGEVMGSGLPPLALPKLGQVCSSGEYSQQGLQPGSATLESTWWSTALGDGAQVQLQSVSEGYWWSALGTPSPIEGSIFKSPIAPSPPDSPLSPSPPPLSSPPPISPPPPPPPAVANQIDAAVNGSVFATSNLSISVFQATNNINELYPCTLLLDYVFPYVFKVTGEDSSSNALSGFNYTSNQEFSSLSFPDGFPEGSPLSTSYLAITNGSGFDGTFFAGTVYNAVFYNNSFYSFQDISSMEAGGGGRRKLMQTGFRDTQKENVTGTNGTANSPPPPSVDYSKYAKWGTAPIGLYTTTAPKASEFITVKRINTTSFLLMAPNGKYISPTSEGYLAAVTNETTAEAVFTVIIVDGMKVQLQAYNGMKVAWGSSSAKGALRLADGPQDTAATWNVREVMQVARMRGVNLGGWLVAEEWMSPALYDGVPDLVDGWQLQLKSATTGKYWTTWKNNKQVHCNLDGTPGNWETYHVRRDNGSSGVATIQLRSRPTGNYLVATNGGGGNLMTDSAGIPSDGSHIFKLHVSPFDRSQVIFETKNGQFIRAKSDGSLMADGKSPGDLTNRASWGSDVTFKMERVDAVQGEWQISRWNPSAAAAMQQFRTSFISEADWKYMASIGINTARIPVGYWIAQKAKPDWPFLEGSLEALDAAFVFAETYNVRIWLSMHAAPGGQNRGHESASRDGILDWGRPGSTYIQDTLNAVAFLAGRYGKSKALFGIGTLNEPNVDLNQIMNNEALAALKKFHLDAYAAIRQYSPCCFVGISGFVGGQNSDLDGHMVDPLQYNNVVYDVHYYQVFTPSFEDKGVTFHLDYVRQIYGKEIANLQQGGRTVMIGEWSLGLPKSAHASPNDYHRFGLAQLETYNAASAGWFFWSLKVEEGSTGYPNWSFEDGYSRKWLSY